MKIGIVTHYYNSTNYGGNLQAYALCKVLENNGHMSEQICYINTSKEKKSILHKIKKDGLFKLIEKFFIKIGKKFLSIFNKFKRKKIINILQGRKQNILKFNRCIPHSVKVYNQYNIKDTINDYDVFITGSDQVWHPSAINYAYTLKFVQNKPKLSYAASISQSNVNEEMRTYFKSFLKDYKAVSVREKNAVNLLSDIAPVPVSWVLDPTLLLSKEEWSNVIEECDINEKFLFCYFLGNDKKERIRAKEFAKKKGLKVVDIPHLQGYYEKADKKFADISISEASVGQFLYLIKNAEYVFTDSFHATVFSLIFEKQFFVFERAGHKGMGERINSLLSLFDLEERFIVDEKNNELCYLEKLQNIDYLLDFAKFNDKKQESLAFLLNSLEI